MPAVKTSNQANIRRRKIVCSAPAKINLTLHVTGQRDDGYHELESLVVFCELGDKIELQIKSTLGIHLEMIGPFAGALPDDHNNIVFKAAQSMANAINKPDIGFDICVEKNLPVASGMGGGSADAAATLLSLVKGLKTTDHATVFKVAETIGSDVPMCLHSRPLIAKGRGEKIEPIANFPTLNLVLINPGIAVATPEIFSRLKSKNNPALEPLPSSIGQIALIDWLKNQRNDLQEAAQVIAPEIRLALSALEGAGANFTRMSGSGATCYGIYDTIEKAQAAALQLGKTYGDWWVVATQTKSRGINRAMEVETDN